jgi:hypothetical protein
MHAPRLASPRISHCGPRACVRHRYRYSRTSPHLASTPCLVLTALCAHSNVRHFCGPSFERFTFHASLLATVSRSAARTARRRYKLRDFAAALELYDQASRLDPLNMVYELNKGAVRLEAEQ